jgi:hypothetical protein
MIAPDKFQHIGVSALLVVFGLVHMPAWVVILSVVFVGLAKEIVWDRLLGRGDPDTWDLVADLAGVGIGVVVSLGLLAVVQ